MSEWIPDDEWATVVEHVPIVSVDVVVECPDGIVLGRRTNEPAQGEWFVPGGRVHKGETLEEAVGRVATEELHAAIEIRDTLGVFEHFYETSELGCSKHYVAHGYHVQTEETIFNSDEQHDVFEVFNEVPADLHRYVQKYLTAAGLE